MHVRLGTFEERIASRRRELESAKYKQFFDGFAEVSAMHMKQIIRLGASSWVPDKNVFEESEKIRASSRNSKRAMLHNTFVVFFGEPKQFEKLALAASRLIQRNPN